LALFDPDKLSVNFALCYYENMNSNELVHRLRAATENEVATALEGAKVALPLTTAYEALEFFNCMVDVLTGQRAKDDAADRDRIPPGFGSTG